MDAKEIAAKLTEAQKKAIRNTYTVTFFGWPIAYNIIDLKENTRRSLLRSGLIRGDSNKLTEDGLAVKAELEKGG